MTAQSAAPRSIEAFLSHTEFTGAALHPLPGDASFRRYVRVEKNGQRAMLMDAPPEKETVAPFLAVASFLHAKGFSAPAIIAQDAKQGFVLLEDLGDESYTRALIAAPMKEPALYGSAVDVLAAWHDPARHFSDPRALPLPLYDTKLLLREVQLFSDWYLPQVLGPERARALGAEYLGLWSALLAGAPLETTHFVHRDYHADNLIWLPEREAAKKVGLLDFQDAVYGDAAYDLVSLLEDARRDVPAELAQQMCVRYMQHTGVDAARFALAYAVLGAQRNSKIIGIFARLAARDGKHHYLRYLPRVWAHLENDVRHPALLPLSQWLDRHVASSHRGLISIAHDAKSLQATA